MATLPLKAGIFPGQKKRGRPYLVSHPTKKPSRAPFPLSAKIQARRLALLEKEAQTKRAIQEMLEAKSKQKIRGKWQVGFVQERQRLIDAYKARVTTPRKPEISIF